MKKILLFLSGLLLIALVFLAGYWYNTLNMSTAASQSSQIGSIPPVPSPATDDGTAAPGSVYVSDEKQKVMGVRLGIVEKASGEHTLRALGRVATDETRIYRINASVDGWILDAYENSTWSLVKKDQILASFYSPEFLSAQQAFIYALGSFDRFQTNSKEPPQQKTLTERNIQQYKDTLHNLGMSDVQIDEVAKARQYTENIQIRSPVTGFVTLRNVSHGERFEKGKELYRIVDLGRIWIVVDLFEGEDRYFKPGTQVMVTLPNQKKKIRAISSSVLPQFDPSTRTLKVRLETDNPGYLLRPDMFVDVEIPITFPPAIVVPSGAILDAGLKKTVFVARENGLFEPRQVETGWRFRDRVEITSGLKPGEKIVLSGNFLIDSESKMELAASGRYGTLARDPVSGSDVAVKKAEKTGRASVYKGKLYYFSSAESKERFDQNPDRYLENR